MSDKDVVIFCTKESHSKPSKYELPPPPPEEQPRGVVLPNGDLNWSCPCLGGLPYGPCGFEFREFFACLHASQGDKTEECFTKFASMKDCFSQFPKVYPPDDDDEINEKASQLGQANQTGSSGASTQSGQDDVRTSSSSK